MKRISDLSLSIKLALLMTLLIGIISIFIFLYFPAKQENQAMDAVANKAESIARIAAFSINPALVFEDREAANDVIEGLRKNEDIAYIVVVDHTNRVFAAFNAETAGLAGFSSGGNSVSPDGRTFRTMVPVKNGKREIGRVFLGFALDQVSAGINRSRRNIAFISVIVFLAGMLGVFIISGVISGPLRNMVETVEKIAQGDLTRRAAVTSRDEVGHLAQSFNSMVNNLSLAYSRLEELNRDLEKRVQERTAELRTEMDERKREEQIRIALEAQLRQSQKLEAIGQLAGGVAHDINNTLMAIGSYCELLLLKVGPKSPLSSDIQSIQKAVDSSAVLTRKLLAFGRKQVLMPKVVDLNEIVGNVDGMLRRLIGASIELRTVLDSHLGFVRADAGQIEQVIINLVVNARDAMTEGGTLTIESANLMLDQASVRLHPAFSAGNYATLSITDSGHGMDEETKSKIFEPFFTTKIVGKGTGLGLSTVYGIIAQSGGFIEVSSEPGHGACFKIYLPRVDEPKEAAPAASSGRTIPTGSETILLVDDNASVRTSLAEIMSIHGYKVLQTRDGKQALEISASYPSPIHLLVTDIVMPGLGGIELADRMKRSRTEIKILYISGYSEDLAVKHDMDSQEAFLSKPATSQSLLLKIRALLDKK